jgi:hypothetical protein
MTHHVTAIISLASLALLWGFLFWLYKDYCIESFRQKVFALRDELFDFAACGKIPFEHKAYGRLRVTMNGAIRFAHELSLAQFLILLVRHHGQIDNKRGYVARLHEDMKDLTEDKKEMLLSFQNRMSIIFLKHIFASSPLFVITLILPLLSILFFQAMAAWLQRSLRDPLEEMQSVAYAAGDD